jgi:hypothetical protein
MKYTNEQKLLIKESKQKIKELSRQQDEIYDNLLNELNFKDKNDSLNLFDYLFNDFDLHKDFLD